MKLYSKWLLAGAAALATVLGLAAAPAEAHYPRPSNPPGQYGCDETYLCQKMDQYGCWCTCYVCHNYNQAMAWYNGQDSNARVIAQK